MKIAQVTDFHFDDFLAQRFTLNTLPNFETILEDIASRGFDRLVLTGDFGVPDHYWWLAAKLAALDIPYDVILGNHDIGDDKQAALLRSGLLSKNHLHEGEYYYSGEIAGTKMLFLDTSRGSTGEAQKRWLKTELAAARGTEIIVFAHHPILNCETAMDRSMALRDRDELSRILEEAGVPITIFCGHYHFTHENSTENVRQFVTPACIMQISGEGDNILSDSFDFGYRIVELSPLGIKTETKMFVSPRKVMPGE